MKIDITLNEVANLVLHVNRLNEWPINPAHVRFKVPKVIKDYPVSISPNDLPKHDFEPLNTKVSIASLPGNPRWSGYSDNIHYRRIHLSYQWSKYPKEVDENGRFIIKTNRHLHDSVTMSEVYNAIKKFGKLRQESLLVKVLRHDNNNLEYDTGKLRVEPIPNSLLYIGSFDLEVVYVPISFLPPTLNGFAIEGDLSTSGGLLPKAIGGFTPHVETRSYSVLRGFKGYTNGIMKVFGGFSW